MLPIVGAAAVVFAVVAVAYLLHRRRDLGTSAGRRTFTALHTASLAAPGLREGLTEAGAQRAVRHLRALLGASAVALTDRAHTLAVDGPSHHHGQRAFEHAHAVLESGRTTILGPRVVGCG
ncbi:MAG TPA: hypothetical protein VGH30_07425, partial [Jatrophihabitantaceae bacterium]